MADSVSHPHPSDAPQSHYLQAPPVYTNGNLRLSIRAFSGPGDSFLVLWGVVTVYLTQPLGGSLAGLCSIYPQQEPTR